MKKFSYLLAVLLIWGCHRGEICDDCEIKKLDPAPLKPEQSKEKVPEQTKGGDETGDEGETNQITAKDYFESTVYPVLNQNCLVCHENSDGIFSLSNDFESDYTMAKKLINPGHSDASKLFDVIQGNGHMGGEIFESGSVELSEIRDWISLEQ
ncbi:MAG: hypothetical protein H6621_06365 [Halobacteriovoraceae bacterium]|nr:hypothetical protein [Halobacteriovoraceae bacterium]